MLTQRLTELVNAAFTGLWVETLECDEAANEIKQLASDKGWAVVEWDITQATKGRDPLTAITETPPKGETTLYLFHNWHKCVTDPIVMQATFSAIIKGKNTRVFIVVISSQLQIPPELQKHFVVVEHHLPNQEQIQRIAKELDAKATDQATFIAAAGLTRYECEGAFALSLVRKGKLEPDAIWEIKQGTVKKSGLMTLHRNGMKLDSLGGLNGLKNFCTKALKSPSAKGILLLGVPGTGKSHFAKALGNECGRPTLLLDIGALMGSLVGETETNIRHALRIADAMAPCILFVDEIEKALAGSTSQHQGDSGVSKRMLGSLLTWLSDHTSDVFFIGTCNDVSSLPPEFARSERFDATFFLDLPAQEQRKAIWKIYANQYLGDEQNSRTLPTDDNWTGAEIKSCCRLASLLDVSLGEASNYIVPVATSSEGKIESLREWASGKCICAETGRIYRKPSSSSAPKPIRKVKA